MKWFGSAKAPSAEHEWEQQKAAILGKTVEQPSVVEGDYAAIDSSENRLAFPIGEASAQGPEWVRLYRRVQEELGIPSVYWVR